MSIEIKLPTNDAEKVGFCLKNDGSYSIIFGATEKTGTKIYWQYLTEEGIAEHNDEFPSSGDKFDSANPDLVAVSFSASLLAEESKIIAWNVRYSNSNDDSVSSEEYTSYEKAAKSAKTSVSQIDGKVVPEMNLQVSWKYDNWQTFLTMFRNYCGKCNKTIFDGFAPGYVLLSGADVSEITSNSTDTKVLKIVFQFTIRMNVPFDDGMGTSYTEGSNVSEGVSYEFAELKDVFTSSSGFNGVENVLT